MNLLDLPEELLEEILHETVPTNVRAWHKVLFLRTVCKRFDSHVKRVAFRKLVVEKSDIRAFRKRLRSKKLLGYYLRAYCRSKTVEKPYLLSLIHQVAVEIASTQQYEANENLDIQAIQDEICDLLLTVLPTDEIITKLRDHQHSGADSTHRHIRTNVIGFAAGTGNTVLLRNKLDAEQTSQFNSYLFKNALRAAVITNHANTVKMLIDAGENPKAISDGKTLVCIASRLDHVQVVETLLKEGATLSVSKLPGTDKFLIHELQEAIHNQASSALVEVLLSYELDAKLELNYWNVTFREAAYYGVPTKILHVLYSKLLTMKPKQEILSGGISRAIVGGRIDMLKEILEYGPGIDSMKQEGLWIMHHAASKGRHDIVQLLHQYNADLDFPDDKGRSPLHHAALCEDNGCIESIKYLLENGVNIESHDYQQQTPLFGAITAGRLDSVKILLKNGAQINVQSLSGDTPLLIATKSQKKIPEIVRYLLQSGADPRARDSAGMEAIHCASKNGNLESVQDLLQFGADINSKTRAGNSVMHFAADQKSSELVAWLIDTGVRPDHANDAGETPLFRAITSGQLEDLELLINAGADINKETHEGETLLEKAVEKNSDPIIDALLKHGVKTGKTLLRMAKANRLRIAWAEKLLQNDDDINTTDADGRSMLHFAVAAPQFEHLISNLVQHGADVNLRDNQKRTPLHAAAYFGGRYIAPMKYLLDNGADPSLTDDSGQTAFEVSYNSRKNAWYISEDELQREFDRYKNMALED